MTDLTLRLIEIISGACLIAVTLVTALTSSSIEMYQAILLLPLIAIPIIFSGMFGWNPTIKTLNIASRIKESIKQLISLKPPAPPH